MKVRQVIYVEWLDSYGVSTEWEPLEDIQKQHCTCHTVGILVYQDKEHISIANTYSPETENTEEQVCGIMTIPIRSILKKKVINL